MNFKKLLFSIAAIAIPFSAFAFHPEQGADPYAEVYKGLIDILFPMAAISCAGVAVFFAMLIAFFWIRQGSMQMRFGELGKDSYLRLRAKNMKWGLTVYFCACIISYICLMFFYTWLQGVLSDMNEGPRTLVESFKTYFERENLPATIFVIVVLCIELTRISIALGAVYALVIYKAWESLPKQDQPFPIILPVILIFVPIANIAAMVMNMIIMPIYMNKAFARYGTKAHWMFLASGAGIIGCTFLSFPLGFFAPIASNILNIIAIPVCTGAFFTTMAMESLRLDYLKMLEKHS